MIRAQRRSRRFRLPLVIFGCAMITISCLEENVTMSNPTPLSTPSEPPSTMSNLIPMPVSAQPTGGTFVLAAGSSIFVEPGSAEIMAIGQYLADRLEPATGYEIEVLAVGGAPPAGSITLTTAAGDPELGEEGYLLTITPDSVTLAAYRPAGLFRGVQTLRQLFPPSIEQATVQPDPWKIPTGVIRDYPRFEWRGMMLDVARHFFGVDDVKQVIDLIAYYKMNRLHLHLSDDQGWRLMIQSWPNLATYGGSTEVGGGEGGYYTQDEYREIVAYASSRYITVVPEIDMPGHTNAALASYAELNCDGVARPLFTGIEVGFSSLCTGSEATARFVGDVIKELAALTPGSYIHIGGDEAASTAEADYRQFVEWAQGVVQAQGKQAVGWAEIAQTELLPTTIAQHWVGNTAQKAVQQGTRVIMSPASKAYLDMKYNAESPLGLNWAGYVEVQDAYTWDPAAQVEGVAEQDILGVEAPLWSETLDSLDDIEFMTFPRLAGIAEIGWSPLTGRNWDEYRVRLGTHGARWDAMGVNYYRSPLVPWG